MDTYMRIFQALDDMQLGDGTNELLWDYLAALYLNGQIMEDYMLLQNGECYTALFTLPESDSLNEKYKNRYVKEQEKKVKAHFSIGQLEKVGKNGENMNVCHCECPSWYMLYAEHGSSESPVYCGDCGNAIPLYRLPHFDGEEEYYRLIDWQRAYRAVDRLWMYGLSDRFTLRQLRDPNSQLSKDAMGMRKVLEQKLGKPVYYFLFHNQKPMKGCPACGGTWSASPNSQLAENLCPNCRLAADE